MRIFVISLPTAAERRAHVSAQLDARKIGYEFFDALTGEDARRQDLVTSIDEKNWVLNTGRQPTMAEIGCFASHRELWKRCVELKEPVMIFEDDVDLGEAFSDALQVADRVANDVGYLRLQTDDRQKKAPVSSIGDFTVSLYKKAPGQMACYCIAPRVAARFIELTLVYESPVDTFMRRYWEHGQAIYALTPFVVDLAALSVETTIPNRVKSKKKLDVRVRRLCRKVAWYLRRWRYNYRFDPAPLN